MTFLLVSIDEQLVHGLKSKKFPEANLTKSAR